MFYDINKYKEIIYFSKIHLKNTFYSKQIDTNKNSIARFS
jgi:hypothetical protein